MTDAVVKQSEISRWWQRAPHLDPRYLIAFLITLVLVAAQIRYHIVGGYARLAMALSTCMATEALLSWFMRGRVVNLQSAYISGISLTSLGRTRTANRLALTLARQPTDRGVRAIDAVPELIEQTCRTGPRGRCLTRWSTGSNTARRRPPSSA